MNRLIDNSNDFTKYVNKLLFSHTKMNKLLKPKKEQNEADR